MAMTDDASNEAWVAEVLDFWFGELGREAWFRKDADVDRAIHDRFELVYEVLTTWPVEDALAGPERALATVIVLDQFPRNMFRDRPQAFATDARALEVARAAVAQGLDRQIDKDRRVFLYLPFEHSEDAADQARSVALISALGDAEYTRYAELHQAVIARFGRFPHRNAVLGRSSTPEEMAFLKQPGSAF
jgi:uncharacterized protein (DUF924 family)